MAGKKKTRGYSKKARSLAAKKGWRAQWKRNERLGKKGRKYVQAAERRERKKERGAPGGGIVAPPPVEPGEDLEEDAATLEERLLESEGTTVVEDPVIRTGRRKK